jgi:molybdopterin synthase catalytic subunit
MARVRPPQTGDEWVALSPDPLPVELAAAWVVQARCGAVVSFSGTARDHSDGRAGVIGLEYEAYEDQAVARLGQIVVAMRRRWPEVGRLVLLHRLGPVELGQSAVVVVAAAAHRDEAFAACRFGIDAVKATVPIWKRETWADGQSWGLQAQPLVDLADWEASHDAADRLESARAGAGSGR